VKERKGYKNDTELTANDLKAWWRVQKAGLEILGKPFPEDRETALGRYRPVFMS